MTDLAPSLPSLPALSGKKVSAAFDGGRISSDGGVLLLAQAEKRLGIAGRLAAHIADERDPRRVRHLLPDILFARYLAIAAGYEDADDLDALRHDPAFKMALGKTPEAAVGLASQPTLSRWENAPDIRTTIRLSYELIDIYCDSYTAPPAAVTLDIDDTFDAAHGAQQLAFWNGFHGERGYAPIHVYEAETARPVAFVLRPAKTPSGREVAAHLRRLVRRIRAHWPETRILLRGDGPLRPPGGHGLVRGASRRRLSLRPARERRAAARPGDRHRRRRLRRPARRKGPARPQDPLRDALRRQQLG
jgi:hypothetical protein